jgi:cell wall-associated NlpC family hydrolase
VSDIEAQIRKVWSQAEPLIEDYNKVHEEYKKNKAKQSSLEKKLEPLRVQIDLAHVRVGALAASVYKSQGVNTFSAIITAGSPDVLADQLSFLDQMARQQERQLASVAELVNKYNAEKAPLDELVAGLAATDADLAKKKKDIEKRLDELQALRTKAYGSTGGTGSYRPWPCPAKYEPTDGYKAAQYACKQAGDPYVWAAAGPNSFDCSGLTLAAWKQVGVYLPHNANQQMRSIPSVSRSNVELGDLVFYYNPVHHVAIYVGDGKVMHAPSYGDHVRMMTIDDAGPVHSFGRPKS